MNPAPETSTALEQVRTEALSIRDVARSITIANDQDYEHAAAFLRRCKTARERVEQVHGPVVKAAHAAHKAATAARNMVEAPIAEAETIVKGTISAYVVAREAERRREEERRRREAEEAAARERAAREAELERQANEQREAAEKAAALAAELERAGRKADAEAQLAEAAALEEAARQSEADIAASEQTAALPVVVPELAPAAKPKGVSTRTEYGFRVLDKMLLKAEFLVPDEVALGKVVRAMREEAPKIVGAPGAIEITTRQVVSARGE